jgi:hypothetical protein
MVLTDRARDAIRRYRRVTDGVEQSISTRFAEEFGDLPG